jgi:hypothetical protein
MQAVCTGNEAGGTSFTEEADKAAGARGEVAGGTDRAPGVERTNNHNQQAATVATKATP